MMKKFFVLGMVCVCVINARATVGSNEKQVCLFVMSKNLLGSTKDFSVNEEDKSKSGVLSGGGFSQHDSPLNSLQSSRFKNESLTTKLNESSNSLLREDGLRNRNNEQPLFYISGFGSQKTISEMQYQGVLYYLGSFGAK